MYPCAPSSKPRKMATDAYRRAWWILHSQCFCLTNSHSPERCDCKTYFYSRMWWSFWYLWGLTNNENAHLQMTDVMCDHLQKVVYVPPCNRIHSESFLWWLCLLHTWVKTKPPSIQILFVMHLIVSEWSMKQLPVFPLTGCAWKYHKIHKGQSLDLSCDGFLGIILFFFITQRHMCFWI